VDAAMPLDPKDMEIFIAHLHKQHRSAVEAGRAHGPADCPVCGTNKWLVEGPLMLLPESKPGGLLKSGIGVPIILMACQECWYCQQFAWGPIKEAAEREGSKEEVKGG
jgi:hypothetical protein